MIVIEPTNGFVSLQLKNLWLYRELVYFLTWREVKVRYKQTALGVAWAVMQPLFSMLVFSLFFGRLAKMPSDGIPYPLFALAGLVPWTFFSNSLTQSSNSLVGSANLISKIYFPRLALPIASVLCGLLDLGLSFSLLVAMMCYYNVAPTRNIFWLPLLVLLAAITALGVGLWFSALNVEFRDIKYTTPFIAQLWMFGTPIVYPSSLLSEPWRTIYGLNPMVGVIEGFRWALLGGQTRPSSMIFLSALVAVGIMVSGMYYFRRMERTFADVV